MSTVKELVDRLNKLGRVKYGTLGDTNSPCVVHETMSTGCIALDTILGGGLPVGRITEIYGDEATGKSLIASQVAALAQQAGHKVLYIDTESAVSIGIMEAVGVSIEEMIYLVLETLDGDDGVFQTMEDVIQEKDKEELLVIIWDTIAATSTVREMENIYGKAMMGQHAQLISQGLRKLSPRISKNRVCALFVNQTRKKIGIRFGDDTTTFGGRAIAYYASARIELTNQKPIKKNKRVIGMENTATVVKNKVATPFGIAVLPIFFGHGIDDPLATFEYMKAEGYFKQNGAWYEFDGDKFQKKTWGKLFDAKYDQIVDLLLGEDS